jgi:hypothetical protein
MRAPPDHKRTPPGGDPRAFRKLDRETTPATRLPDDAAAVVVELAERRARRLLAHLGLLPTVPVCSGCCRCYGTPIGAECWP